MVDMETLWSMMTHEFDEPTENIIRHLRNKEWRMSHLYKIKDKKGKVVRFLPNSAQQYFYDNRHQRNIIPKARQRGISTGILIDYLDDCLFTPYLKAATLAHREPDALKLFASKVRFPYDHLPQGLTPYIPRLIRDTTSVMEFSNDSIFTAETRVRSDTVQRLHVSELAALFDQQPTRAEEVKTGAFPAAESGIIDVESTMKGRYGTMFDLCEIAKDLMDRGVILTAKDFKFFFFSWYGCEDYVLDIPVDITAPMVRYFQEEYADKGINLTEAQKWWYVKEHAVLGDLMKQEYPKDYEESVQVATDAMYFGKWMVVAKKEGRIGHVPHDCNSRVYAAQDIGHFDAATAWTFQMSGMEIHILDYMERSGEHPSFFHEWFQSLGYPICGLGLPHDAESKRYGQKTTPADDFRQLGYNVKILDKADHELHHINLARRVFPRCYFDKVKCARGLECLDKFRKGWNEKYQCFTANSVHDEYSHGAKGFIYLTEYAEELRGQSSGITKEEYRDLKRRHKKVI